MKTRILFVILLVAILVAVSPAKELYLWAQPYNFSDSTFISIYTPCKMFVNIEVRDYDGHLVRILHSGTVIGRGRHSFVWKAKDQLGLTVPYGSYFVHAWVKDDREVTMIKYLPRRTK